MAFRLPCASVVGERAVSCVAKARVNFCCDKGGGCWVAEQGLLWGEDAAGRVRR